MDWPATASGDFHLDRWLRQIAITHVEPCLADPAEWRLYATPDADLAELMPYLNAILPGARYTHETRTLSFRRDGMLVTVMPREVRLALVPTLGARSAHRYGPRSRCGPASRCSVCWARLEGGARGQSSAAGTS